ncbi:MAG: cupin domain-containing protein, partial [Bacteroidetes bacterium]
MSIIHTTDCPEFYTDERCYIRELLNADDLPGLSVAQARVQPGVTTALHALDVEEVYYILQGQGLMECNRVDQGSVQP